MSDEIKVASTPRTVTSAEASTQKSSKLPWIVLGVVVVVIIVLGVLFRGKLFGDKAAKTAGKPSGYQAVFLTNGQVYFGKMQGEEKDYITLKDIFYLQVIQPTLQGNQQEQQAQQQQAQPQISLVKLGNELHGPVDEMHISKSQVLFFEDLKGDGKVVEAINSYKANPQGNTPAAQQQQQVPAAQQQQQVPTAAQQQQVPPVK